MNAASAQIIEDPEIEEDDESIGEPNTEAFEREYQLDRSWEDLAEDEDGRLLPIDPAEEQRTLRRRIEERSKTAGIKRGLIRFCLIILDASSASTVQDFKPNRFTVIVNVVKVFIHQFFDQNPLSQIGLLYLKNGKAGTLSFLSASPEAHVRKLDEGMDLQGEISLQNGLEMSIEILKSVPGHGHREVILLLTSLNTADPGNIFHTIQSLKNERVRVSVLGLAAEVYIYKHISEETKGKYFVALTEKHLEDSIMQLVPPPAALQTSAHAKLVRMGFPEKNANGPRGVAFIGAECVLTDGGFTCNRCKSRVAELPCQCHVCGLTLVSAPQIARSYHHLFPIQPFQEIEVSDLTQSQSVDQLKSSSPICFGCLRPLEGDVGIVAACVKCKAPFCFDCDFGDLTLETLELYSGFDPFRPILLSVQGLVYNVSEGAQFYGRDGSYAKLAGRECARALAKMSLEEEDLNGNITDCTDSELETLMGWVNKLKEKYPIVGRIVPSKILTLESLKEYDGTDDSKPMYLAISGVVFDVSSAQEFYGPDGMYPFAGHECARAFALFSVDLSDCNDNLDGLTKGDLDSLEDWKQKFRSKYHIVGSIVN
eukprot:g1830.t1